MTNPFDVIEARLSNIETLLLDIKHHSPNKGEVGRQADTLPFEEAVKFLNNQGYPISESQLYKLTSTKQIPFKKFGRKLIFSRGDLLAWSKLQLVEPTNSAEEATLTLARSARRKRA
ncbi:hypothetical protein C1N53_21910 [Pontibacter sp. SGAir0037]|nr:hypothetical protein C1N53_21910 [Pontibacter sp. SGAir0037]